MISIAQHFNLDRYNIFIIPIFIYRILSITGVAESGTQTEGPRSVREVPGPGSLGC